MSTSAAPVTEPLDFLHSLGFTDADYIQLATCERDGEGDSINWQEFQGARPYPLERFSKFWSLYGATHECFFRVQPADKETDTRAGYTWERYVAFGMDFDFKEGALGSEANAWTLIWSVAVATPFGAPDIVVLSGNGLHVYWLVDDDLDDMARAQLAARKFDAYISYLAETEFGWTFDDVADAARVLRLPGSLNRKDPEAPVAVRVVPLPDSMPRRAAPLSLRAVLEAVDSRIPVRALATRERGGKSTPITDWPSSWPSPEKSSADNYRCNWVRAKGGYEARYKKDIAAAGKSKRHKRAFSWAQRIVGLYRAGCISEVQYYKIVADFNKFFEKLVTADRKLTADEIGGLWRDAINNVEELTWDELLAKEVQHESCDNLRRSGDKMSSDERNPENGYTESDKYRGKVEDVPADQRAYEWLIENWLIKGGIVPVVGDPAVGKSTITGWIVAEVINAVHYQEIQEHGACNHNEQPVYLGEPANALIFETEDGYAETWVPRINANGGFIYGRVKHYNLDSLPSDCEPFNLDSYIEDIIHAMKANDCIIGIVESADAYLQKPDKDGRTRQESGPEVKRILTKLHNRLRVEGLTLLILLHEAKNVDMFRTGAKAAAGSIGWGSVARTGIRVFFKAGTDKEVRVTSLHKNNVGADNKAKYFTISARVTGTDPDNGKTITGAHVKWHANTDNTSGAEAERETVEEMTNTNKSNPKAAGLSLKERIGRAIVEILKDEEDYYMETEKLKKTVEDKIENMFSAGSWSNGIEWIEGMHPHWTIEKSKEGFGADQVNGWRLIKRDFNPLNL